ncbi:helix-turn-helix domain-containing protein [Pseudomonas sp. NY15372]|uniref:helix-turn-helix domain-containing protein n=1 Tax=Pseudomonas sp. NY15372 TaxID=3400356 RepID=UPI003A85EF63
MSKTCIAAILSRLKLISGCTTDIELARALGISPQTLSSWKVRGRVPYSLCVALAEQQGLSLDWLLLGDGPQARISPAPQADTSMPTWEADLLVQLRELSDLDLQTIRATVQDKLRIYQLERRLEELASRPGNHS